MLIWAAAMAQDIAPMVEAARRKLTAERHCPVETSTDVTVCGLRRADRYRVPIVAYEPGDPAHEGVPAERARLLHRTTPIDDRGPFLVGGGMAGVSVNAEIGGGAASGPQLRTLAP